MQYKNLNTIKTGALAALFLLGGIPGCGTDGVLKPESASLNDSGFVEAGGDVLNPEILNLDVQAGTQPAEMTWNQVGSKTVEAETVDKVNGSRYELTFGKNSLKSRTTITISERDPKLVDVELGPDGTKFESPVLLVIDYSGTANDPSSPDYNGLPARLFWFNPDEKTWEAVPGTDDRQNRRFSAWLSHFSRYAMGDVVNWNPLSKHLGRGAEIQWR